MAITLTFTDDEYNTLINMLIQSNPLIQKIAQQAQPQIQAQQNKPPPTTPGEPPKTPEVAKPSDRPSFERERRN